MTPATEACACAFQHSIPYNVANSCTIIVDTSRRIAFNPRAAVIGNTPTHKIHPYQPSPHLLYPLSIPTASTPSKPLHLHYPHLQSLASSSSPFSQNPPSLPFKISAPPAPLPPKPPSPPQFPPPPPSSPQSPPPSSPLRRRLSN